MSIFSDFKSFVGPLVDSYFRTFSSTGSPKWCKDVPKRKKKAKRRGPRKSLAKEPRLEGAEPLKMTTVTHLQLFLRRPRAPKKKPKWKLKWSHNRTNPLEEHSRASLWEPLGSIWGAQNDAQINKKTIPGRPWASQGHLKETEIVYNVHL